MEGSSSYLVTGDESVLRILHVTDLHTDCFGKDTLYSLKERFIEEWREVDIVIVSGDFVSIEEEELKRNDPLKMNLIEEDISSTI